MRFAAALLALFLVACDQKSTPQPASTPAAVPPAPKLDTSRAKKVSTRVPDGQVFKGLNFSTGLPWDIQLGKHGSLELEGEGTTNIIINGEATLGLDSKGIGLEKNLRIHNFAQGDDTGLVQVNAGIGSDTTIVGATPGDGLAPVLIDSLANKDVYFPVGFYYEDETKIIIRFTPGNVIQKVSDLPSLSKSRPAQKLTLLYRVNMGRSVKYFALDQAAMVEFDPPVPVKQGR